MARKISNAAATNKVMRTVKAVTEVRNSAVPPKPGAMAASGQRITHETIARRAYEIYSSGKGGTQLQNWLRAETELRTGR